MDTLVVKTTARTQARHPTMNFAFDRIQPPARLSISTMIDRMSTLVFHFYSYPATERTD
jgi:hypothetical protein